MMLPKARRERRAVIAGYCRRLSLSQTAVTLCEQATPTQEAFLEAVLAAELTNREVGRRARLLTRAGFPALKTLAEFDRRVVQLPRALTWDDLEAGTFIAAHQNLVCYGPVGLGNYAKSRLMDSRARDTLSSRSWRSNFLLITPQDGGELRLAYSILRRHAHGLASTLIAPRGRQRGPR